jgi:hypothetical protein
MTPLVTPPIACSFDARIEAACASTDSDRSKQSPIGAAIKVFRRIKRMWSVNSRRRTGCRDPINVLSELAANKGFDALRHDRMLAVSAVSEGSGI